MPSKRIVVASVVAGGLVLTGIVGASFADARSHGRGGGGSHYGGNYGGGNNHGGSNNNGNTNNGNTNPGNTNPGNTNNGNTNNGNTNNGGNGTNNGNTNPGSPLALCANSAGAVYSVSGSCPTGYTPVTTESLKGPKGDKGDQGVPGDSRFALKKAPTLTINANSPAHKLVTLDTGIPYSASTAALEVSGNNANDGTLLIPGSNPVDYTSVTVTEVSTNTTTCNGANTQATPNTGATVHKYCVSQTGFTGSLSFDLNIWWMGPSVS